MDDQTFPAVTVCIPSYNGAAHLPATIESVLNQEYRDFELLIVDDHSIDNTADVVARYRDPRLRFMKNAKNLGPEANWNRCLHEARGRYIKLLPQDDLIAPTCLAKQVAVFEQIGGERIALVFCARRIIDGDGRQIMIRHYGQRSDGVISAQDVVRKCFRRGTNLIGEPGSVLFRTDQARRVGAFDATYPYVIDLDYWFRLLHHGDAYYITDTLSSFRLTVGSWSVAIGERQGTEFRGFVRRIAAAPGFFGTWFDLLCANVMATLNTYLRLVVYRLFLKRRAHGGPATS